MTLLHEIHKAEKAITWNYNWDSCKCSYCEGRVKLNYGLNIPKLKQATSWWVIKYWSYRYIRFTLPKWVYNFL